MNAPDVDGMTDAQALTYAATLGAPVFPPALVARLHAIGHALRQIELVSAYVDKFYEQPRL